MESVYGVFGFKYSLALSTRPEKYLGEVSVWNRAEKALEECLTAFVDAKNQRDQKKWELEQSKKLSVASEEEVKQSGEEKNQLPHPAASTVFTPMSWSINPGDGAFYGPKIDIQLTDALNRRHQCATVQLDFQLPIRFELSYKDESGQQQTPVIIHRAILGSVERMMAVLIEHTGGKWPFWLSPRQICLVPVTQAQLPYAEQIHSILVADQLYADIDTSSGTLNKKIREAQLEQYNLILVLGEKEKGANTVTIRWRDHPDRSETQTIDNFRAYCQQLLRDFE